MAATHLVGTNAQIDLTFEGLTFRRTKSQAAARGVPRLYDVDWSRIEAAVVVQSGSGKPRLHVQVSGTPIAVDRALDPHVVKVKRGDVDQARAFADLVNREVATRAAWARASDGDGSADAGVA